MDINTITISGRLTKTAELWGEDGNKVAHFDVAVNRGFGDKQKTHFIPCSLFKADNVAKFLVKGSVVVVNGAMEYSDSKDGKRYWNIAVKDLSIVKYAEPVENKLAEEAQQETGPRPNRRSLAQPVPATFEEGDDLPF